MANAPTRGDAENPKSGALYQVKVTSFINGQMLAPGSEVEYDGLPGDNLIPINAKAKAAAKQHKELRTAKYEGDNDASKYTAKQEALREADNKLKGIGEDEDSDTLPEADPALLKHAEQTRKDTENAEQADPDFHRVKMSGEQTNVQRASTDQSPADKNKPDAAKAK